MKDETVESGKPENLADDHLFRVALRNSSTVLFNQDRDLKYTWIFNPHPGFSPEAVLGKMDSELLAEEEASRLTEIKNKVMETGTSSTNEVMTTINDLPSYYDLYVEPLRNADGTIAGVTCVSTEVTKRKQTEMERERIVSELHEALSLVKTLRGLLSICASCKKIKDEKGHWVQLERYVTDHSEANFTHGCCPECYKEAIRDLKRENE